MSDPQLKTLGPTGAEMAAPNSPPTAETRGGRRLSVPNSAALLAFLLLEVIFFALRSPYFFNWSNWTNILTAMSVVGVLSCGMTLLLVAGQFDLSVGSGIAFVGVVLATLAPDVGVTTALVIAVLAGIGIGAVNGFFVTVVGVNALITTLGAMAIFRGLTLAIGGGQNIAIDGFSWGIKRPAFDIPVTVLVFVAVTVLFAVVLTFTVYGRSMYAIGSNLLASRLVGLKVRRNLFAAFVVSGLCMGLAGLMNASLVGSTSGTTGTGLELAAITAVILGGTSLQGGPAGSSERSWGC
ncbi:ABC transporter permease [Nocardioides mesophilus]|uniref:ABC transporter permease n=1 Tax=Nocardioides mesophilus TaxID=433659 RepID=UPI001CB704DD|nr:ABC transporter permease [Nocardioides mesophilus]